MKRLSPHTSETSVGVCLGASSVSLVRLGTGPNSNDSSAKPGNTGVRIIDQACNPHEGNPRSTLKRAIADFGITAREPAAVTGRRFRQLVNMTTIAEPEAVELAYRFLKPPDRECRAIVSAGGETFMVYTLDQQGRIANVLTGNKCASGTGEFFQQQLRRMNVSFEEAARWGADETPHHVSGRCSVFCKSDCTHATNKGVPKSRVAAGLGRMMANKILELLKNIEHRDIMLVGGTVRNRMMVAYLEKEIQGLVIPAAADCFEALGAALWAGQHTTTAVPDSNTLIKQEAGSFDTLPPLSTFSDQVTFKTIESDRVMAGDDCLLGLDVGSTTTKAILLRRADNALLASVYLRTDGDPVGASRKCYQAILDQVAAETDPRTVSIQGLGVCGSGRQIAGLHALSDGVINEISAHAAAAVHFDPQVDTLFEIGGQDAKYTYITNGVPSDYAMNEACSAGTGSFLEESALESLGEAMEAIAEVALEGDSPPNFNDQCAAFIASDIKNAIHEGIRHEDIVAGLVYSICMNYTNRVRGNRPVGKKVFMQGGVCYNRAVPLAMAALTGKPIIVPPEPGLMGAFGVALEVKKRIDNGLLSPRTFDLAQLVERRVSYLKPFMCGGGKEKCDRRCEIALMEVEGRKYPFGGACNRYENLRRKISRPVARLDLVRKRQRLVYEQFAPSPRPSPRGRGGLDPDKNRECLRGLVGFNRSFMVHNYYPLYTHFFSELGYAAAMPETPSRVGIDRRNSAFCFPGELAHGFFHALISRDPPPNVIFLPHLKSIPVINGDATSQVCPFVQGEPFFLRAAFKTELDALTRRGVKVLSPLLDLAGGMTAAEKPLVETAGTLGVTRKQAHAAFAGAQKRQQDCEAAMQALGQAALDELTADPERIGVVIFARPYNGFVEEAHMGIPHKLASRGVLVIPLDCLPLNREASKRHMYWGMGHRMMRGARVVRKHPQLFGAYITNFSCGPDSFLIGYFREVMGAKPSLTLELDSHTADAGIETRIEAFLDIVSAYRRLQRPHAPAGPRFQPARNELNNGRPVVVTSSGRKLRMSDERVTLLFPSMGKLASEALAAGFRGHGFNTKVFPPADEAVLKLGRAHTSCKECLPLILTTGALLSYVHDQKRPDEVVVYFMPTGSGPCRFGQYKIFMEDLVRRLQLPDVAIYSLSSENGYAGMGNRLYRRSWEAVVVSDMMEDIRSMLLANSRFHDEAMTVFDSQWQLLTKTMADGADKGLLPQLTDTARILGALPMKRPPAEVPVISLTGEIFVRRDGLSRRYLTEKLAGMGFAVVCTPVAEWVHYIDYLVAHNLAEQRLTLGERFSFYLRRQVMKDRESRIHTALNASGLSPAAAPTVPEIIDHARPYISRHLAGEAVLTIGGALSEIASHACGVIAIGPFGCMPNRLSESILNQHMNRDGKLASNSADPGLSALLSGVDSLPFLAIESDGSPFPQLITAKLESFCLRAERLHQRMRSAAHSPCGRTVSAG